MEYFFNSYKGKFAKKQHTKHLSKDTTRSRKSHSPTLFILYIRVNFTQLLIWRKGNEMPIIISGYVGQGEDLLMSLDMMKMIWTAQNVDTPAAFLNPVILCQKKKSNFSREMQNNHRWEILGHIPEHIYHILILVVEQNPITYRLYSTVSTFAIITNLLIARWLYIWSLLTKRWIQVTGYRY